jgi:hypothetical protein
VAFDRKSTTAKGFVITISKEEGNRRTKKEYEEFTRHLNHVLAFTPLFLSSAHMLPRGLLNHLRSRVDPLDLPPSLESCEVYGDS